MSEAVGIKNEEHGTKENLIKKSPIVMVVVGSILAVLFLVMAGIYVGMLCYYKTHFLPGTTVNGMVKCDGLEAHDVVALLENQVVTYELKIIGRNKELIGTITGEDAGKEYRIHETDIKAMLESQDEKNWIKAWLGRFYQNFDLICDAKFDEAKVLAALNMWEALDKNKMVAPRDAYISDYVPDIKGYEIVPEISGTTLDISKVEKFVLEAVTANESSLNLEEKGCYLEPQIVAQDKELLLQLEELNCLTGTRITYDWNGYEVILDGDTIHEWIVAAKEDSDSLYMVDMELVAEFVAGNAKKYDTYGKSIVFTTALGEKLSVLNGGFGWKTDREKETEELIALIENGTVTEREPVYRSKGVVKGSNDPGTSYVEIDLTNQHLYLFWKGELVVESDFVSGNMSNGNTTPGGLYKLTYRTTDAVLRGADYETPVKYWMPFNGNIGMHDATWRSSFGGDIYLTNGSHGCINLPLDKAELIFAYVSTGFPIVCYYY